VVLTLSLFAALAYGFADFLGGLGIRKTSASFVVVSSQAFGFVVLVVALLLVPGDFYPSDIVWGAGAGCAGAIGIGALYAALARGRMGIVSPITAVVSAAFPVAFGLASGERPPIQAMAGIGLAFVAVALVSTSPGTGRVSVRDPAIALAVVSGLGIGALYIFLSRGHADAGLWLLVPTRITSLVVLGAFTLVRGARVTRSRRIFAIIAVSGALDMGANVLYVLAAHGGMLTIVAVVTSLYPAATVFLARLLLDERLSAVQWAGVASAATGVVLIALANPPR
jgi:drug/metabolite transporter (DMT)-like permease